MKVVFCFVCIVVCLLDLEYYLFIYLSRSILYYIMYIYFFLCVYLRVCFKHIYIYVCFFTMPKNKTENSRNHTLNPRGLTRKHTNSEAAPRIRSVWLLRGNTMGKNFLLSTVFLLSSGANKAWCFVSFKKNHKRPTTNKTI